MAEAISFRPLVRSDFSLLHRWLMEPHVAAWWREPGDLEMLEAKYGPRIDGVEPTYVFIIVHDGRSIGWIQWYRWSDYPDHAVKLGAESSSAGVDFALGEIDILGRGIGWRALAQFIDEVVFAAPDVVAVYSDPEEKNVASLRTFEKAGFEVTKAGYFDGNAYRQLAVRKRRELRADPETPRTG
jgi:aminoglycoside 6'-N-acetyltransferase